MADEKTNPQTLTVQQVATLFGKSDRYFQNLVKDGFIKQERRGEYLLKDVCIGVCEYYDSLLAKSNKAAVANRASETRTKMLEQQMEIKQRNLVPRSDFYAAQDFVVSQHRAEIISLSARVTRDIDMRRKIESAVDDIFNRTAERIERAAHALEAGGPVLEALGENRAGSVGEEE